MNHFILTAALGAATLAAHAQAPTAAPAPGDAATAALRLAHDDLLAGRFEALPLRAKSALELSGNDPKVAANVGELLAAARKAKGSALAPDWKLPAEIGYLKLGIRYIEAFGMGGYRVNIGLEYPEAGTLEQLRFMRYPDEVILDKAQGIGEFSESPSDKHGIDGWIGSNLRRRRFGDGLYTLDLKMKGRPAVKGWVILSNMSSTAAPVVRTPTAGEVFDTERPTFRWTAFRSPQYQAGEERRTYLKVRTLGHADHTAWSVNLPDAQATEVTVGSLPPVEGGDHLPPGRYSLSLISEERHHFGEIIIARQSDSRVPFSVRKRK